MQPAMEKVLAKVQEDAKVTKGEEATYRKVKITPKLAEDILALQDPQTNRKLDQGRVTWLAGVIEQGKWNSDVGSILMTKDGRLIDGQHRLSAVVKSGKAITAMVLFGADPDAIKFVDTGKRRTTGQTLAIMGKKMPAIRLATANLLAHFERIAATDEAVSIAPRNLILDPDSVLEYLEKYHVELEAMASVLFEHGAACVYAPLVFAAKKYPKETHEALNFIKEGQITNSIFKTFHLGQKRLLRKGLGSGTERAETVLYVFDLIKALVQKKAPKAAQLTKLKDGPEVHTELVRFFSDSKRSLN